MLIFKKNTMKTNHIKIIFAFILVFSISIGCTKEDEYEIPSFKTTIFQEDFDNNTDNETLNTEGWFNYAQIGTRNWTEQVFSGNGYAEFTSFNSNQDVNIAWLISPEIDMDNFEGEKLFFQTAHNFLTNRSNTIELLISTDFDGVNFEEASWINVPATFTNPDIPRFIWVNSGAINLSEYKGKIRFGFKVTGSGNNSNLDGTFQLDNIRIYN